MQTVRAPENLKGRNKDTTYNLIFSAFLEKVKNKNSLNTFEKYKAYYDDIFINVLNLKYDKISSLSWQRFFNDLKIKKSPHVTNDVLKFAKAAANYAMKHNLIDIEVIADINLELKQEKYKIVVKPIYEKATGIVKYYVMKTAFYMGK